MTPRTFFALFIKIIGIYLVLGSITMIPQFLSTLMMFGSPAGEDNTSAFFMTITLLLFVFGLYYLILRYCLFKTDWIIDKLALDKHFAEGTFDLNIHRSTVLTIAVIVNGGLLFIDALPGLCRQIYYYIGDIQTSGRFGENPYLGWLIFEGVRGFIGYFLVTRSRYVVCLIEWQSRKA